MEFRFAIYCRKSTDTEDKQVLSLESQEQELSLLATKENLNVVKVLTESMSAKEPGRPRFTELLKLITTNKIDAILCWKIDRLTRNPIDGGQIQWLLQTGKIKCIRTFEKSYFPSDNVMLINIEQAMATQYIRDLSVNVKRGNRAKLEKGEWPNHAPLGYVNDKATKTIRLNKKESHYVLRAFELYSSGLYTLKQISDILHQEGLRTKSGKKVFKGQIHKLIINKFYCGLMERDGKIYQGNHKPIISIAQFNQAQNVLNGRRHLRTRNRIYGARGLLKCAECDCSLTADTQKGHSYYYCTNGKGICTQHKQYIRSELIDQLITDLLEHLKFDMELIELCANAMNEKDQNSEDNLTFIVETLIKQTNLLLEKESALVDGYTSKIIREELYKAKMKEIELKRLELQQQMNEIQQKGIDPTVTFERVKNIFIEGNKASKFYKNETEEGKRTHLQKLLSNIVIKDKKIVSYQYKSPYDVLAKTPKNANFLEMLAVWDVIRTSFVTS